MCRGDEKHFRLWFDTETVNPPPAVDRLLTLLLLTALTIIILNLARSVSQVMRFFRIQGYFALSEPPNAQVGPLPRPLPLGYRITAR
jgi:hypothetical protein